MKFLYTLLVLLTFQMTSNAQNKNWHKFKPQKWDAYNKSNLFKRAGISTDIYKWTEGAANIGVELFVARKLALRGEANINKEQIFQISENEESIWKIGHSSQEMKIGLYYFPFEYPRDLTKKKRPTNRGKKSGCKRFKNFGARDLLQGIYIGTEAIYRETNMIIYLPKDLQIPEGLELDLDYYTTQKGGGVSLGYAVRLANMQLDIGLQTAVLFLENEPNPLLDLGLQNPISSDLVEVRANHIEFNPFVKVGFVF